MIENFANKNNKKVLAKIPFDKKFAQALVELEPLVEFDNSFKNIFDTITKKIEDFFEEKQLKKIN